MALCCRHRWLCCVSCFQLSRGPVIPSAALSPSPGTGGESVLSSRRGPSSASSVTRATCSRAPRPSAASLCPAPWPSGMTRSPAAWVSVCPHSVTTSMGSAVPGHRGTNELSLVHVSGLLLQTCLKGKLFYQK